MKLPGAVQTNGKASGPFQDSRAKVDSLVKKLKASRKAAFDKFTEALGLRDRASRLNRIREHNSSSRLMRLPPELRNRIWELALGGHTFHVLFVTYSLAGERCVTSMKTLTCRSPSLGTRMQKYFDEWSFEGRICYYEKRCHATCNIVPREQEFDCSLLRTCRSIYHETSNCKYFSNTFVFTDFKCLSFFSPVLGTMHSLLISSMQLDITISNRIDEFHWDEKIRMIARMMMNLKEIHISIERPTHRPQLESLLNLNSRWEEMDHSIPFLPGILDLRMLRLRTMTLVVWDTRSRPSQAIPGALYTRPNDLIFRTTSVEKQVWALETRRAVLRL